MRMLLVFSMVLMTVVALSGHTPDAEAKEPIVLTWADYAPPDDNRYAYYRHFADRVRVVTGNQVEIKFFPAEQLVKTLQQYEALMQGTIDICALVPAYYAGSIPLLALYSETSYWDIGDSAVLVSRTVRDIDGILQKDGIKFLGWSAELPPSCFVGPRSYRTLDDIKGQKIRGAGMVSRAIKIWGGTGVSIPAAELYMALQRGVVDGSYQTIDTTQSLRLWEVSKAVTFGTSGGSPTLVSMNLKKWEGLPKDVQAAFETVSREMPQWVYNRSRSFVKDTEGFLSDKFAEAYKLTQQENDVWEAPVKGFISKPVIEKVGPPAENMWEKILTIATEVKAERAEGKTPRFY